MCTEKLEQVIAQIQGDRVLVAPLDWGLGHATRCVPIIKSLLNHQKKVFLAGSGNSFSFLKKEFPKLECVELPSMSVLYSKKGSLIGAMIKQLPYFIFQIFKEHFLLKRIVCRYDIQTVISDNRFGLWCQSVESIYITHQIMVKMPRGFRFLERAAYGLHKFFISRYNSCWIPDVEGEDNLSGDLSRKYTLPKNAIFIGWLSRFSYFNFIESSPYKVLALISGPEPQRSIFEKEMLIKMKNISERCLLIRGLPFSNSTSILENVHIVSHLDTKTLQFLLHKTPIIYCRSGYSTLMDLAVLKRRAVLLPTPGQTEQEYLASYNKGMCLDELDALKSILNKKGEDNFVMLK